jgi:hypothetical protein
MLRHELIRQLSINYATDCCFIKLCISLCSLWLPLLQKVTDNHHVMSVAKEAFSKPALGYCQHNFVHSNVN